VLERFANVVFWLSIVIAIGWLLLSYFAVAGTRRGWAGADSVDVMTALSVPIVSVGIGWIVRYVLVGR
jgi:uncharacterized membrane protein YhdT